MNLADELRKLQDLHRSGALNDEEFAAAKAAVLAQGASAPPPAADAPVMQEHLEEIRHQNEVAQLDREWALQRERFLIVGQYGVRQVPTQGMSLIVGIMAVGFGILWMVFTFSITSDIPSEAPGAVRLFPLFGLLFIIVGVSVSIYCYSKATQYQAALADYQRRRAALLGRHHDEPS